MDCSANDDGHGRLRSQTYPFQPSVLLTENNLPSDRDAWLGNSIQGRGDSSPLRRTGRGTGVLSPLKELDFGFGSGMFLQKKRSHGGNGEGLRSSGSLSRMKIGRSSPTPTSCESGSSTSRSGSRVPRRRNHHHRKDAWGDEPITPPTTRQQRLVTSMFALVVVLGSIQIVAFIVHPPRGSFTVDGLSGFAGRGINDDNRVRRRASGGVRDTFTDTPSIVSGGGGAVPSGGLRGGPLNNNGVPQYNEQGLSLSNPRAFEMVAADMGHLKDTVEKLDRIVRETMGQHGKDLAAVLVQLGLERPSRSNLVAGSESRPIPAEGLANNNAGGANPAWPSPLKQAPQDQLQIAGGSRQGQGDASVLGAGGGIDDVAVRGTAEDGSLTGGGPTTGKALGQDVQGNGKGAAGGFKKEGARGAAEGVAVWNAYQRGKWVNGQWVPKVLQDDTSPDLSQLATAGKKQRRVLLLSEKRSGGQAVGGVLNADTRVFYVADPCRMGGGPEALDAGACSLAVTRLLACQPTTNDIRNLFSFSYIVERSRVLSASEGLRWQAGGTPDENDEETRAAVIRQCRLSSVVVVKETRLAEVAPRLSTPELGLEFLHIVRDPRAAIHGMAELWEKSDNKMERSMARDCSDVASRLCTSTENKLKFLTFLGKQRFRVLKHEMFVEAPYAMTKSVYSWLQLGGFPYEVTEVIRSTSMRGSADNSPGTAVTGNSSKSTMGGFDWATRWAVEMPTFRRQQVQLACQPLLVALGYDDPEDPEEQQDAGEDGQEESQGESSSEELSTAFDGISSDRGAGGTDFGSSMTDGVNRVGHGGGGAEKLRASSALPSSSLSAATAARNPESVAAAADTILPGHDAIARHYG